TLADPPPDRRQAGQDLRWRPARAGHRNILKSLQRVQTVLRGLRGDGITHAVLWIQPERGGRLKAAAQRDQQVAGDVPRRIAGLAGLRAVHIDVQLGLIKGLLDVQVDRTRNVADSLQQVIRKSAIVLLVVSHDLNIDGSGQTEVQNLADNVSRKEREGYTWELI